MNSELLPKDTLANRCQCGGLRHKCDMQEIERLQNALREAQQLAIRQQNALRKSQS